jgi:hypothetical protein
VHGRIGPHVQATPHPSGPWHSSRSPHPVIPVHVRAPGPGDEVGGLEGELGSVALDVGEAASRPEVAIGGVAGSPVVGVATGSGLAAGGGVSDVGAAVSRVAGDPDVEVAVPVHPKSAALQRLTPRLTPAVRAVMRSRSRPARSRPRPARPRCRPAPG